MKYFFVAFFSFYISFSALAQQENDWANFAKYEEENRMVPAGSVVFIGSSSTEAWIHNRPDFFKKNNYTNRGISGQVSSQMLVRFRKDVIDLKPKAVVILAGTNDIAQNNGYISLENILGNIISMCELAKLHKIQVILCSILPAYEFSWRKDLKPADDVIALNNLIRSYADANKIMYVDYHSAMKDDRNGLPKQYAEDGIHPTIMGYEAMEKLLKPAIDKALKESAGSGLK